MLIAVNIRTLILKIVLGLYLSNIHKKILINVYVLKRNVLWTHKIKKLKKEKPYDFSKSEEIMDCQHLVGQLFLGQHCLVFDRAKIS